jgi:hypothetical protein
MDVAFNNTVGYINPKIKKFEKITEGRLTKYWIKTFELDDRIEFERVRLIKAQIEKGEEQYYMLNAFSTNGKINIISKAFDTEYGIQVEG